MVDKEVKVYTITVTSMITEYLKSKGYEFVNQLSDEEFFKVSELSGMSNLSLKDFQNTYNMHDLNIDFIRFKTSKNEST
jgi:hypothetical protein